ncbi:MAG TPA: TetR/AcrR family transcriptional regulator [Trebonia sp.]|jgi:AcrR family transcriptional regulator|nr:TetR/AcrR family transcriptional regulator [Trebonia sp.]
MPGTSDQPRDLIKPAPSGARSARIHQLLLEVTGQLLDEGGLPAATVDAIAARSGVSKMTIYNHWPSRIAIAASAFAGLMGAAIPVPDTGSLASDVTAHLVRLGAFYASEPRGKTFAQLLAACVDDEAGAAYFREYFLAERDRVIERLWQRALDRGEADPEIGLDEVIDILAGALIFRRLAGHHPLTEDEARKIARAVLRGLVRREA